jgi:hypothetical protein
MPHSIHRHHHQQQQQQQLMNSDGKCKNTSNNTTAIGIWAIFFLVLFAIIAKILINPITI